MLDEEVFAQCPAVIVEKDGIRYTIVITDDGNESGVVEVFCEKE